MDQGSNGTGLMVTGAGTATIVDNSSKLKCKYICGGKYIYLKVKSSLEVIFIVFTLSNKVINESTYLLDFV
jgi:hypothetical protein